MNILILNWKDIKNPTAGGAERVTYEHAKRWVDEGHKVTWLSSSYDGAKSVEVLENIKIIRFGNIYGIYLYAPFFYLFSGNKFDAVIDEVHGIPFFTPIYVRKPILVMIHEIAGEIWDYMYPIPINYLGKFLEKFYLRLYKSKKFWAASNGTVEELVQNGIPKKNCIVISSPSNTKSLDKLPTKNSNITFVWVSRIVKMKGIEDVLDSFKLIVDKYPESKLKIIGSGKKGYVDFLKNEKVKKNNIEKNIEFLGFINEKEKTNILRKSHILLHASVKEGWGIVVIEAASQATPSVVYNVAGLNESVNDGKTGIVVAQNSPQELAKASIRLLNDKEKYKQLQKNCLTWANSLKWPNETAKSLKLIENLNYK